MRRPNLLKFFYSFCLFFIRISDRGFRLRYDVVACGGQFIGQKSGELISPTSKSKSYFHNAECVWDIEVKENYTITLRFEYMDVEVCGRLCHCDYVKVFDGFEKTSQQILGWLIVITLILITY